MTRRLSPQSPDQKVLMILLVWHIVSSFYDVCLVPGPCDIFHTPVARYSPFMLKLPLNTNQLTNHARVRACC